MLSFVEIGSAARAPASPTGSGAGSGSLLVVAEPVQRLPRETYQARRDRSPSDPDVRGPLAARVAWNEALAAPDDLARSQRPLFEIQRRRHVVHAPGIFSRFLVSPSIEACTAVSCFLSFFPELTSRFEVRRRLSGSCPILDVFSLASWIHGINMGKEQQYVRMSKINP